MKLPKSIPISVLCLGACLLSNCRADRLSTDKYAAWIAANQDRLTVKAAQPDLLVSLTYLPADWLALRETGLEKAAQLPDTRREYAGLEYYRLHIALAGGQGDLLQFKAAGTDEYYQRVEYFSFGLQHDIHLLAGADTLSCRLFHFERNYGAAPYADFMLGFEEKPDNYSDRTLLYDDRVYNNCTIQLTLPNETIQRIPKLKL